MNLPINFKNPIKINKNTLASYEIIPDYMVNNTGLADFIKIINGLYSSPLKKLKVTDKNIEFSNGKRVVWEIHLAKSEIKFYLMVPKSDQHTLINRFDSIYDGCAIQPTMTDIDLDLEHTLINELKYDRHSVYSINTNIKNEIHLKHILSVTKSMDDNEKSIIQIIIQPTSQDWKESYQMVKTEKTNMAYEFVGEVSSMIEETIEQFVEGGSKLDKKRFDTVKKQNNTVKQLEKMLSVGFNVQIRVATSALSLSRREDIMLSISSAFRACDNTNSLINTKKSLPAKYFLNRTFNYVTLHRNMMCAEEIAKLIQLPSGELMSKFDNIEYIKLREADIPKELSTNGIPIGNATRRNSTIPIFFPTESVDSLCLPRAFIGGMGSGKSSYASNFGIEAFDLNYNVIAFDVADGRMVRQLRDSVSPNNKHRIVHLDFGNLNFPIALVWNEATLTPNRMSSEFIKFIEIITGELGVRTRRWMKKAFLAVFEDKSATIMDALYMILESSYRIKKIPIIKNKEVKQAWIDFEKFSDKDKNDIINPIMNRLDYLLDDDNLVNLLCKPPRKIGGKCALDFSTLINQDFTKPYQSTMILISIPKMRFGSYAIDIIMAFLINKIWLTLQARPINSVLETGVPTFILMDEPHQFMRSSDLWREMVVETRKWRGAMVWFFHTWEQIKSKNSSLAKEMKSAGMHYVLYSSSKDTWRDLAEEIAPFTINEALELPKYHAIVKMAEHSAVMCHMIEPIDQRRLVYDNKDVTYLCSRQYGTDTNQTTPSLENIVNKKMATNNPTSVSDIVLDGPDETDEENEIGQENETNEEGGENDIIKQPLPPQGYRINL